MLSEKEKSQIEKAKYLTILLMCRIEKTKQMNEHNKTETNSQI